MANLPFEFEPDIRPLAARMRPKTLSEYFGQTHVLGADSTLCHAIEAGRAPSMLVWGPPGVGKTTLAHIIANHSDAYFIELSAVTAGVKEVREAVLEAKNALASQGKKSLLFIDEVHRFNKSQQDALLPHIENGTFLFVGATTENPSFAINNALMSRCQVITLNVLADDVISRLLEKALSEDEALSALNLNFAPEAMSLIAKNATGDARRALNTLETLCQEYRGLTQEVSAEQILAALPEVSAHYDKGGDAFYDLISAFHKSVRGSSPDAALYWYARILAGGGDPLYVARRLLAIATEDIGNADPRAMQVGLNAWDIYHRVGPKEGERAIAQATLYMASCAKSNAVYDAFNRAKELAKHTSHAPVPHHLRNAPTQLMKGLGYGEQYRYAHNEENAYAAGENYFPKELAETQLYTPTERGLEVKIKEKLAYLKSLDAQSTQKRYDES